jgi:hypothetical protein
LNTVKAWLKGVKDKNPHGAEQDRRDRKSVERVGHLRTRLEEVKNNDGGKGTRVGDYFVVSLIQS